MKDEKILIKNPIKNKKKKRERDINPQLNIKKERKRDTNQQLNK
jgi:hypothetical protein